jgi:hypothetical protein
VGANLRFACLGAGLVVVVVPAALVRSKKLKKARAAAEACKTAASDFVADKVVDERHGQHGLGLYHLSIGAVRTQSLGIGTGMELSRFETRALEELM